MAAASAAAVLSLCAGPALAQDGPSLAETLNFVVAKMSAQGPVSFNATMHPRSDGDDTRGDLTTRTTWTFSNFQPDLAGCTLHMHAGTGDQGPQSQADWALDFRKVTQIQVMTEAEYQNHLEQSLGGMMSHTVDPEISAIVVKTVGNDNGTAFPFYDQDMANRVANAMQHAVDLCGGGAKEPF
jgi:hypothetical protein